AVGQQANGGGFVFLDAGEAADVGIEKKVVVEIVVGGGNLAHDAFVGGRVKRVPDARDESHARTGRKHEFLAGGKHAGLAVHGHSDASGRRVGGGGSGRPEFQGELAGAADDVLLFLGVGVGRRGLAATGIHQLFAILGLVGEVDEGQPVAGKVAEAEVGDVPRGGGRQRPAVAGEAGEGGAVGGVDLGTFHGVTTDRVAWLCRAAVQSSWWATASSGVAQPKRPSSLPARSARKAAHICMRMS